MSFVQPEFLVFFLVVLIAWYAWPNRLWQNLILVVGSAIFYGWIHPWFLILLYASATLDYAMGLLMRRYPARRRWFLALSLAGNLGMLGTFKYLDFFIGNVVGVLEAVGVHTDLRTLGLFLPVGISFYTFQTMSYTIDVYRGELEPRRNFIDYLVFVSFFPQLVAGPVERASNLLPQVERPRRFDRERFLSGLTLALWGAFKKVAVADTVALYVDRVFLADDPAGALAWAGALAFALQILADFSGYTDIARGTARMLGFELMENFRHPYLARSPSDFWRRWHISFSSWIRDYLYIPLGGSRGNFGRVTRTTFIAMLLSGLWHGASWTFVLWGAYHAALLTAWRVVGPRVPARLRASAAGRVGAVGLMFACTIVGWLIFRETDPVRLLHFLTTSPLHATPDQWVAAGIVVAVTAVMALPLVGALLLERGLFERLRDTPWILPARTTAWAAMAVGILIFARDTTHDFIYFQF